MKKIFFLLLYLFSFTVSASSDRIALVIGNSKYTELGSLANPINDAKSINKTLQEMGYEIVTDKDVTVGDKRIANPTQEGSPVKVSVGQGVQAYVMRQKQEWFDEDQKAKQLRVDELEKSTKRNAEQDGLIGKLKISQE